MRRTWLVLALSALVLLAGCSGFGGSDTPTPSPQEPSEYPPGWAASGLTNQSAAVENAATVVSGTDFTERQLVVAPSSRGPLNTSHTVQTVTISFDYESQRLVSRQRTYGVSEATAREVISSGTDALGNRSADRLSFTYVNRTGGKTFQRFADGSTQNVTIVGNFSQTVDQRLPFQFENALTIVGNGTLSAGSWNGQGWEYQLSNVSAYAWEEGSGRVVVSEAGLVTELDVDGSLAEGPAGYHYGVDASDNAIERPSWAD